MHLIVFIFILASSGIFSAGCTKSHQAKTDTLVIGISSAPASLDPRFAVDANGMRILSLMFHSFVRIGADLRPVADAARSWEWQGNDLILSVPKDLRFHNGEPVTKEDILFTFEAYSAKSSPFRSALSQIEAVNIEPSETDFKVRLKFKKYSAKFLASDLPIVRLLPKKSVLSQKLNFGSQPIGTGPYQLEKLTAKSIVLKVSPHQKRIIPKIQRIEFKVVEDEYTLLAKLKKGSVHLVQNDLPRDSVDQLQKNPDFQVKIYPGLSFSYLLINWKDPLLSQKSVRKAIALSLDREAFIEHKLSGLARPATSLLSPINPYFMSELKPIPYDIRQARELIKKRGLKGTRLSLKTSSQRSSIDNGYVLSKQIEAAGLDVNMSSMEWGSYLSQLKKGQFQLATMRWIGAVDPDLYRMAFHSDELPPGRNRGSYINPDLDKLLDAGLSIRSESERKLHYFKVQKMIFEDLAIIPLWYDQQVVVIRKNVKNYDPVPNSDFSPVLKATLN